MKIGKRNKSPGQRALAAVLVFVPGTRGDLKNALCVLQGVSFLEVYTLKHLESGQ